MKSAGHSFRERRLREMKNKSVLSKILSYTRPYMGYLMLAMIFALVSVGLTLYAPFLTGNAIDRIIDEKNVDFDGIFVILIKFAVVVLVTAITQWLMNLCTNKLTYYTVRDIRIKAFDRLQIVPLKYIDAQRQGDIISRMITDVEQISDGLLMGFTQLFSGIVTIFGTIGFMISIDLKITLVVVLITPISLFVAGFIAKRTFNMFKIQSQTRGEMTSLIEEMVGNQKVVKAFCYEDDAEEKFEEINQKLQICGVKALFYSALTNPCTRFVNGLVYSGVGIFGAISALSGRITVGQLSCFLSYANQYTKPFNEISGVITELQSAFASAKRVFEIIEQEPQTPDSEKAVVLENADGRVELDNVSFSYSPEVSLIENLSLSVKPGQRIAIVGPTGCGKTTIINLLMRFYDVNSGEISVSGYPIKEITRDSLRSMYGMVLQETWLKSATVFENIAYGKPDATMEEVVAAAKAAHCHSFIMRLPKGYMTEISDEGANISQGQKQLLCIARVMLCLPPMLILDEATSSIDTLTEIRIQKAFAKMMQGRTSFIVAHRLSTIKEADCILVMDKGHIIEQGTHGELLQKGGFYANLYNSQFAVS